MNKIVYHNSAFYGDTETIVLADGYAYAMVSVMNENPEVAVIHDLTVHKDRRGEGLGSLLIDESVASAKDQGAKVVRLSCPAGSWLETWYKRHGFAPIGMDDMIAGYVVLQKDID